MAATMRCEDFRRGMADWMEGGGDLQAASHVKDCAGCRALVRDLQAIASTAAAWPEAEPPTRLWTSIRVQLENEGLIRTPHASWWERLVSVHALRPAFAGTYIALLVAVSLFLGSQSNRNIQLADQEIWLHRTQASMAPLDAELKMVESKTVPFVKARNPDVLATLNRNLAIVDNMIAVCEKSVREDPQNEMTRDYLYTAYQQKANLLATMTDSGVEGR